MVLIWVPHQVPHFVAYPHHYCHHLNITAFTFSSLAFNSDAKGIRRYKRDHQEGSRLNSVELFRWVENNFQNDSDVEDHNRFASYLCPSEKLDGRGKMATL
jgi:hypothetical protein